MDIVRQMQSQLQQSRRSSLASEACAILARGGTIDYEFAREALGFSPRFAARQNLSDIDKLIIVELFVRFEVRKNEPDPDHHNTVEQIARDLKLKTPTRVVQLQRQLADMMAAFMFGGTYSEFDQKVAGLRNAEENRYVTYQGVQIMVCKHGKEKCAACKTDLTVGNQYGMERDLKKEGSKLGKKAGVLSAKEEEWQAYENDLGETWKKQASKLFKEGALTGAEIANKLEVTEKNVKNLKRKWNLKRTAIFGSNEISADKIDALGTDFEEDNVEEAEPIERVPFVSSFTDLGKYTRDFSCKLLPLTSLSMQAVDQISMERHQEEECFYDCFSREIGGAPQVDADIVSDAFMACRVVDNPELFVMLEEIFGTSSMPRAGQPSSEADLEGKESLKSYYFGVAAFFDALYFQEEARRKKELLLKGAKHLQKAILGLTGESAENIGRRLRAVWFLYRLLRLIVHNGNLDRFLTELRKQLGSVPSNVSDRLTRLHLTLHFAKIKFESHLNQDALTLFLEGERALDELLAEVESGKKTRENLLFLPGGGTEKRMPKMERSAKIDKVAQRDCVNYACCRDILNLHLGVLYRENRNFYESMQYFNALENSVNNLKRDENRISETKFRIADGASHKAPNSALKFGGPQHVGLAVAFDVASQRNWKAVPSVPDFFCNSEHLFLLEASYIYERLSCFLAANDQQLALMWLDQYPWSKHNGNPRLRRTQVKLLCNPSWTLEKADSSFNRCFRPDDGGEGDFDKLLESLNLSTSAAKEPRKVNPLLHTDTARLYYEILGEDALRKKDWDRCLELARQKLKALAGLWDRVAVYQILRASLQKVDAATTKDEKAQAVEEGQRQLTLLRKEYKAQMQFHEFFFVLYLENELTTCSQDEDRVLLRVNKFKKQFPREVALCNVKQSRDWYERSLALEKPGQSAKARKHAEELAKRATRYSEGRLWLAFLTSGEGTGEVLNSCDSLALLELVNLDDDSFLTVDELAESFSKQVGEKQLQERLERLLELERSRGRPEVDMVGHPVLIARPEEFSWTVGANKTVRFDSFPMENDTGGGTFAQESPAEAASLVSRKVVLEAGCANREQNLKSFLESARLFCRVDVKGLDGTRSAEFLRAISKGWCARDSKAVGLKLDSRKLVKIKINGDSRLWTGKVYANNFGKKLLLFEKEGNHAAVERAKRETRKNLEIVKC